MKSGGFMKAVSYKENLKILNSPTIAKSESTFCPKDGNILQHSVIYSISYSCVERHRSTWLTCTPQIMLVKEGQLSWLLPVNLSLSQRCFGMFPELLRKIKLVVIKFAGKTPQQSLHASRGWPGSPSCSKYIAVTFNKKDVQFRKNWVPLCILDRLQSIRQHLRTSNTYSFCSFNNF